MIVFRSLALASLLLATSCLANAQGIIYQDDFSGSASTPLYGLSPDVDNNGGGNTWVTRTDTGLPGGLGREWYADGHIDTTLDINVNGAASLAFTPAAGNIYVLSVRFNQVIIDGGESSNWLGVGFASGQATGSGAGAEFFGNDSPTHVTGHPWMMVRASNTPHPNQWFLGPGANAGGAWTTAVGATGGPVDLRIVLDTTTPAWTVDFLAKNPADAGYTNVGSGTYAGNPTIGSVAVGGNFNIGGSIDDFSLTVVPEPGSIALGIAGLVMLTPAARRRLKNMDVK